MYIWDKLTDNERDSLINVQVAREHADVDRMVNGSFQLTDAACTVSLEQLMTPVVEGLDAYFEHYLSADRARLPEWMDPVSNLGTKRIAYCFIKALLALFADPRYTDKKEDGLVTQQLLTQVFVKEVWEMASFFAAREQEPEFYRKQSKYHKNWDNRRRKAFAKKIDALPSWTFKQKATFATAVTSVAHEQNIVKRITAWRSNTAYRGKKYDVESYIMLTDDVVTLVERTLQDLIAELCPTRFPMHCRPLPLTEEEGGGWRTLDMRSRATYVTGKKNVEIKGYDEVGDDDVTTRASLDRHSTASRDTINALQRTEWTVNDDVLDAMLTFWRAGQAVGKVPEAEGERARMGKMPDGLDEDEQKEWKRKAAEAHGVWHRAQTARIQFLSLIKAATLFKGKTFWHAWFCDFRGRFYSDAAYLNPQGDDLNKALLQFADPYAVTHRGLYWLKVGLANEFGFDKASFDDRVAWVDERWDLWRAIAADPISTVRDWEDDSPMKNATFSRLARVLDLVKATDTGFSSLPVQLDGACNGVQHWAAMTRDVDVADKVNITPQPKPQDLYQFVADGCTQLCHDDPNPWRIKFLEHWDAGITRKVCKRSVMCDPYGISDHSVRKYVQQEGHVDWVPKAERAAATKELGTLICQSKEIQMRFVNHGKRMVSDICSWFVKETRTPFWWRSPNGFEVVNHYPQEDRVSVEVRVWTKGFDKHYKLYGTYRTPNDEIHVRKSASAMPPNWVHSIDGGHMSLTVNRMTGHGIVRHSYIHDSFGCPAEDVPLLRDTIKETFHAIHSTDLLAGLLDHAQAAVGFAIEDDSPIHADNVRGDLDIDGCLQADYIFG
ncbi:MAG: hypothetical protein GY871_11970 [Actinomycetales bacterium]|nr:hypothetical protein [Actinomycetales bacterium]